LRRGGSATRTTASRGATSTPSDAAVMLCIGFFFAFMMFGSVA
jgi:hypothetical protein